MKGARPLQRIIALGRILFVVLLALTYSGSPRYVLAALGFEEPECATDCAGSLEDNECPPGCPVGPCAKCPPAVMPAASAILVEARPSFDAPLRVPQALAAPVSEGLFQPPKA
ncbi:hypothetical protein [Myxococcus sp. AB036A]|uniref:hypothetical protein n=1 Tax=Myxococcus sp. AB036A TaxID=2562793 RepID=UPI001146FA8E|nr:hypothetical protein [Myxococcus sp. AB036A]